jgi:ferredoxin-NADP reductase
MWADVIFREELAKLAAANPGRLTVTHTLTREENPQQFGPNVRRGRIGLPLLREMIPDPRGCYVYVCGPGISKFDVAAAKEAGTQPQPRFLEAVLADLKALGVPDDRIKREFYG